MLLLQIMTLAQDTALVKDFSTPGVAALALGLVVWIVRHLLGTTIPNLQTAHKEDMEGMRKTFQAEQDAHKQELNSMRETFQAESTAIRAMFSSEFRLEREAFERILDTQRKDFREELAIVRTQCSNDGCSGLSKIPS